MCVNLPLGVSDDCAVHTGNIFLGQLNLILLEFERADKS